MPYTNILVAVDTTDEADEVLVAARNVANDVGSALSIICVMKPITEFYVNLFAMLEDSGEDALQAQAEAKVKDWLAELAVRNKVDPTNIYVVAGVPAREIHRQAEAMTADLIVVGTHGKHGMQLMLGSTANAVLHDAPCDVLAARIHSE